ARRITLPKTYHVGSVSAGKRAEVEQGGAEWEPSFQIAFSKRAPKEIELTMTDMAATKVACPLGEAVKSGEGLLGVFLHDNALHCLFREESVEVEDTAPA
ncbi:MAG: hypothetical protein R3325_16995, partial [Thermoanaerobaculia bacterium]|nr:hypothetical protein [Thermoanaerobaculia bacterium]